MTFQVSPGRFEMLPAADDKSVWDMAPAGFSSGGFFIGVLFARRTASVKQKAMWAQNSFWRFGKMTLASYKDDVMGFSSLNKYCLPLALLLLAKTMVAEAETPSIDCDGQQYYFENSLFGAKAKKMTVAEWQDFCVPENPEILSQKLIIRDDEIWCLSFHHITPDTQPLARQSWILNTAIGTLQITDYIRRSSGWLKKSQKRIKCQMPDD